LFKVSAASLAEYFSFDPERERDLRLVDGAIRQSAPSLKRWFVAGAREGQLGMKMSLIGYGRFTYEVQASPLPLAWPIMGLALQKNYRSLYCSAKRNDRSIIWEYKDRLGSITVSENGVINFTAAQDFNMPALSEMLQELVAGLQTGAISVSYRRLAGSQS
jgi:hypothetical protein